MNILIVDDCPDARDLAKICAEKLGHSTLTASNPEAAIAILEAPDCTVDCIITDNRMPQEGQGLELLAYVQRKWPLDDGSRKIARILMTGTGRPEIFRKAESLGATALTKPFHPAKLNEIINAAEKRLQTMQLA